MRLVVELEYEVEYNAFVSARINSLIQLLTISIPNLKGSVGIPTLAKQLEDEINGSTKERS